MAWLGSDWLYRQPLTIANHSGVAAPEAVLAVPAAFGKFWENVDPNFNDIRITTADGITLLNWAFDGTPSIANRTMTIHIDDTNHNVNTLYGQSNAAQSASVGAFLYWGNDTANLASGANNSTNITVNSSKTAIIDVAQPGSASGTYVLECAAPTADQLYPTHRIRKQVNDETKIYWDLSGCIESLSRESESSSRKEEIAFVKAVIYDQDGNDTTSAMTVLNSISILSDYVVQMPIKAGDHEKRYLIIMTFGIVDDLQVVRVIDQRATLIVKNLALHTS
ncbi:MAG: hypothetical protein GOVbin1773_29 [Prokaryotic dsDNA virus sp.]|jgi:hypothetical protein|nr:MAG: hypothetical protein GOVbin1773_29 [Prokaryotic dsDNA virus sp.]|tara:strand:+ start:937 stop:1773 length:837 start_codon:yes stop_codon:yes gene_type:complete